MFEKDYEMISDNFKGIKIPIKGLPYDFKPHSH